MNNNLVKTLLKYEIILLCFLSFSLKAQEKNIVLEYCAGTWCSYCSSATDVIENSILPDYPNVIILAYHGWDGSTDPFSDFDGKEIIPLLNFNSYPTGRLDRIGEALPEYLWLGSLEDRESLTADINIQLNGTYTHDTRDLQVTVQATSLTEYKDELILTLLLVEDNLIYPQAVPGEPGIDSNYVHNNVVRLLISDLRGDELNGSNIWRENETIITNYSVNVDDSFNADNCRLVAFISRNGKELHEGEILQATQLDLVADPASINEIETLSDNFSLEQNYPNPFNPSTTISYSIFLSDENSLTNANVSLTVFDILGSKICTLIDESQGSGKYSVVFDGSDLSSGIYLYTLSVEFPENINDIFLTKKLILMK